MKHIARNEDQLFIKSMGKNLRITAIFDDTDAANNHMERHDDAVIAEFGPFIFLANQYDNGSKDKCRWIQDDDGCWHTGCGQSFELNLGTPKQNHMNFCYSCGSPIMEHPERRRNARKQQD